MVLCALLSAQLQPFGVLVFSKTAEFRHDSIEAGQKCFAELGKDAGFVAKATEDATEFTVENLAKFKVVVFLNTTGDVLNAKQEAAFKRFVTDGGGFVGVHAAADTEYDWPWYGKAVGAYFKQHPAIQQATVKVVDRSHPATKHLAPTWVRTDEWYDYRAQPVAGTRTLCELDTTSYQNHTMGETHPITWCQDNGQYRTFYTGFGHTVESYQEPGFRKMLAQAVLWSAKRT